MTEVTVLDAPHPAVADAVRALAETVGRRERREALREDQRDALARARSGWTGLVTRTPERDRVTGYAGVLREGDGWSVERLSP